MADARLHHLTKVNDVLRRPGMYGRDEMAERLLLEAMAAVDGVLDQWWEQCDALRERGAFAATGVAGAYGNILPADAVRCATASIYAEIAHRLGWLYLDRVLPETEYQQVADRIEEWVTQDRTASETVEAFGAPSLLIGSNNPYFPRTLVYATADPEQRQICFHLWNAFAGSGSEPGLRGVHAEPVVLAVRHRPGAFPGSFSFTPEGTRRRPAADQRSPSRPTVWIFHGDRARFASAVFDDLDAALTWAAGHEVTGILAEYAKGGTYDVAVSEGRFTPSAPHHGTAGHVAAFSPGLRHIHLVNGLRDQ